MHFQLDTPVLTSLRLTLPYYQISFARGRFLPFSQFLTQNSINLRTFALSIRYCTDSSQLGSLISPLQLVLNLAKLDVAFENALDRCQSMTRTSHYYDVFLGLLFENPSLLPKLKDFSLLVMNDMILSDHVVNT